MSNQISQMRRLPMDDLPGVSVYDLDGTAERGRNQTVLVVCDPNAEIPLHTHSVDAVMYVVSGRGTVLSGDPVADGAHVGVGSVVSFKRDIPHGFRASEHGLTFVSKNGGICDTTGEWDLRFS